METEALWGERAYAQEMCMSGAGGGCGSPEMREVHRKCA